LNIPLEEEFKAGEVGTQIGLKICRVGQKGRKGWSSIEGAKNKTLKKEQYRDEHR